MPPGYPPKVKLDLACFKPGYWGAWLLLLLLWLITWLPRKVVMSLGGFVGDQMRLRNGKRRKIAAVNIRLCFPELSQSEQQELLEAHFRCYGRVIIDMGLSMMSTRRRLKRYVDIEGTEHISGWPGSSQDSSQDSRQNVIMIAYHTTTMDIGSCALLHDTPVVGMMKRDKHPVYNWFLHSGRTRFNQLDLYMRDQSPRGLLEGMKQGRICLLIPDEDHGEGKHAVYAPFFGRQRSTLNMVSRLAKKTSAVVIPFICILNAQSGRYKITVAPPLEQVPSDDHVSDATGINQAMEALIRQAPEQYMWTFRWFRTQPDGADPYNIG